MKRDKKGRFVKGTKVVHAVKHTKKNCIVCNKEFGVPPSLERVQSCSRSCAGKIRKAYWTGKKRSKEDREKMRQAKLGIRGEDHWNWKGGKGTIRHRLMGQDEYKKWRMGVFGRDNFTCRDCGSKNTYLEAHHVEPWSENPNLRYDVDNGLTYCKPCHVKNDEGRAIFEGRNQL